MSPIEATISIYAYSIVMLVLSGLLFMWSLGKRPRNYKKELNVIKKKNEFLLKELSKSMRLNKQLERDCENQGVFYRRVRKKYRELRASCTELLFPRDRYLSTHEGNLRNLNEVYVRQTRQ